VEKEAITLIAELVRFSAELSTLDGNGHKRSNDWM
jgi:hypothetical protein